MKKVDIEIQNLIRIAKWIKSCKTKIQLDNIEKFLKDYYKRVDESNWFTASESHRIMYHIGFVDGMVLTLQKTKFN